MSENKILFVDDDEKVLNAIERKFEDQYDIETAVGPIEGIEVLKDSGPFAVVISDMRMPEMTGIEMLEKIKEHSPETVRMMLTGFADLETTVDAINRGSIFRFLSKPCSNDILELAMNDGIRQHDLIRSEKELVEGTLKGSVKVLSEVLGLVNPVAFGRASRVKRIAMAIAEKMGVENTWELEIAAMLSSLGCVTLDASILNKLTNNEQLSKAERERFEKHPAIGRELLESIPRLENVAEIVAYQEKHFDGGGVPFDKTAGKKIPLGARILKVALDFDAYENLEDEPVNAVVTQRTNVGRYDPDVLSSLESVLGELFALAPREIRLDEVRSGMVFAENVMSTQGQLLIAKGHEATYSVMNFLENYADQGNLQTPILVFQGSVGQ